MAEPVLIETFRSFSQQDRRALGKWVNSPFFNQREDVQKLFEYMCDRIPAGALPSEQFDLHTPEAYLAVLGKNCGAPAKSCEKDMRYTMSFLLQTIKQFLAYSHWASDSVDVGRHLCKSLRQRGLDRLFEKEYAALAFQLNANTAKSADFYFHYYHLELERWEVFRRTHRSASDLLEHTRVSREIYFATETLRQACAVLAQPGDQQTINNSIYLKPTLEAIKMGEFSDIPAVQAYFHCYKLMSEQDAEAEPHFEILQVTLDTHWTLFPSNEIRDLYVGAINYCIRRLNSGTRTYIQKALHLYRSGLQRQILLENGFLNRYTYNNILLLAVAMEDWEWALSFLETYKTQLPPRERESAWQYNLARYHFQKKEYAKAQEILRGVEFRDIFYHLDARRMLVRTYFASGEIAPLESLLDSFQMFLQRSRNTLGYHKELNLNFVRFMKKILRVPPTDFKALQLIEANIRATRLVAEREWLLEQCLINLKQIKQQY